MLPQPVTGVRSTIGTTAQAHACEQTLQSTVGGYRTVRTGYVIPGQRLGTNRLPIHGVSVPIPVGDGVGAVTPEHVAQPRACCSAVCYEDELPACCWIDSLSLANGRKILPFAEDSAWLQVSRQEAFRFAFRFNYDHVVIGFEVYL